MLEADYTNVLTDWCLFGGLIVLTVIINVLLHWKGPWQLRDDFFGLSFVIIVPLCTYFLLSSTLKAIVICVKALG